jgi:tetratricopeptide (TPR) repeat protein
MSVVVYWGLGRYAEALANFHPFPDPAYFLITRIYIGTIHLLQQENEAARREFELYLEEIVQVSDTRYTPIALSYLSIAWYRLGNIEQSRQVFFQAFDYYLKGNIVGTTVCFQAVVYFLLEQGEIEMACELYPVALRLPNFGKSAWLHDFLGARLEKASQALPEGFAEAARERGMHHELLALVAEWKPKVRWLIPFP